MFSENRNTILAIVLSLIVLLGWQYFVAQPQLERQQAELQAQQAAEQAQAELNGDPTKPTPNAVPGQASAPTSSAAAIGLTREQAIASSERVKIETP
ncbi:MAG: membrane protein insertase YidC, partial [Roseibium sp.]